MTDGSERPHQCLRQFFFVADPKGIRRNMFERGIDSRLEDEITSGRSKAKRRDRRLPLSRMIVFE